MMNIHRLTDSISHKIICKIYFWLLSDSVHAILQVCSQPKDSYDDKMEIVSALLCVKHWLDNPKVLDEVNMFDIQSISLLSAIVCVYFKLYGTDIDRVNAENIVAKNKNEIYESYSLDDGDDSSKKETLLMIINITPQSLQDIQKLISLGIILINTIYAPTMSRNNGKRI